MITTRRGHRLTSPGRWQHLALLVGAAVATVGLVACGGSTPSAPASAPPTPGTYIGKAGPDALVAVVVGQAGDARALYYGSAPTNPDGSPRSYDELTAEWFDAVAVTGDKLEGSSSEGYTLNATAAGGALRGTVAGPGREPQQFEASPVTGTAGLYDVTYNPADQSLTGTSAAGATLAGKAGTANLLRPTPIALTLTPAGGAAVQASVSFFPGDNTAVSRLGFIVAEDGTVRGGPRKSVAKAAGKSGGSSFTCPIID